MGETARERFHRMRMEGKATLDASHGQGRQATAPTKGALPRSIAAAVELASRKRSLVERLGALGVDVAPEELPNGGEALEDMEHFVDAQERAAK